jgi:hypothetical protein
MGSPYRTAVPRRAARPMPWPVRVLHGAMRIIRHTADILFGAWRP